MSLSDRIAESELIVVAISSKVKFLQDTETAVLRVSEKLSGGDTSKDVQLKEIDNDWSNGMWRKVDHEWKMKGFKPYLFFLRKNADSTYRRVSWYASWPVFYSSSKGKSKKGYVLYRHMEKLVDLNGLVKIVDKSKVGRVAIGNENDCNRLDEKPRTALECRIYLDDLKGYVQVNSRSN